MPHHPFSSGQVQAVFDAYPQRMRAGLLNLRELVLATGASLAQTGGVVETLKWGEPAYLPKCPRVGTTVRLSPSGISATTIALRFHCQTRLAEQYREAYPGQLRIEGGRAILLEVDEMPPQDIIRHCVAMAFTYHGRKR